MDYGRELPCFVHRDEQTLRCRFRGKGGRSVDNADEGTVVVDDYVSIRRENVESSVWTRGDSNRITATAVVCKWVDCERGELLSGNVEQLACGDVRRIGDPQDSNQAVVDARE